VEEIGISPVFSPRSEGVVNSVDNSAGCPLFREEILTVVEECNTLPDNKLQDNIGAHHHIHTPCNYYVFFLYIMYLTEQRRSVTERLLPIPTHQVRRG
jgi:hypothetical protein